jgi:putative transposase
LRRLGIDETGWHAELGARHAPLRTTPRSLSSSIGGFKAAATRQFRAMTGDANGSLWRRGYYEHVVRDERDFARIGGYIADNAANWQFDSENAERIPNR